MSTPAWLQATRPTDIGVPGPTSLDMARAFRSVRADPLSFLVEAARALRRPRRLPGARGAGAAGQRPGRRPARAADVGAQLGQADRAVRRAGAGDRARACWRPSDPSWIEHRRLGRPGLPPPAARGGGRRGPGSGRRRAHLAAHLGAARDSGARRPGRRRRRAHPPDRARRGRPGAVLRGPVRPRPAAAGRDQPGGGAGGPAGPLGPADGGRGPRPRPNLRLRSTRRRLDSISAGLVAQRRARGPLRPAAARGRPPRPPAGQRPDRRRDPLRAGHHGDRRPRDRRRGAGLDADAAGRAPARPRTGCAPSSPTTPGRCPCSATGTASPGRARSSTRRCACSRRPGRSRAARSATT